MICPLRSTCNEEPKGWWAPGEETRRTERLWNLHDRQSPWVTRERSEWVKWLTGLTFGSLHTTSDREEEAKWMTRDRMGVVTERQIIYSERRRQEAASPRKQTNGDETSFLSKRLVCDSEEVERLEFPEVTAAVWKGWSFPGRFNRGLTVMSLPTLSISTTSERSGPEWRRSDGTGSGL